MKNIAGEYFKKGYSCSESIVQAAIDKGYAPKELLCAATPFSGGMGVRCLCGAVAGSQIVIGSMFGKTENRDGMKARAIAKRFNEKFAEAHKVNCCKVLSAGFDFHSPERKQNCLKLVQEAAELVEETIKHAMEETETTTK